VTVVVPAALSPLRVLVVRLPVIMFAGHSTELAMRRPPAPCAICHMFSR
jgi:hypothetical protein